MYFGIALMWTVIAVPVAYLLNVVWLSHGAGLYSESFALALTALAGVVAFVGSYLYSD